MQPSLYMPIMTRKSHQPRHLVVGTRASPLAQAQTRQIVQLLCAQGHFAPPQIKITALATRGDAALDIAGETPLADIGGKGLFTAELDAALRDGRIDFAVHSLKDLPTALPDDLVLAAVPPRGDARDVLVYHSSAHAALATHAATAPPDSVLQNLPQGAKIGTASLRRAAQLCALRPDCVVAPLRGNIGTRLDKLENNNWMAIMLAAAGLVRLDNWPPTALALPPDYFVPAAGQGALAVQCRADDDFLVAHLAALNCNKTQLCVTAERAFLAGLDGSCRTPIAAYAHLQNNRLVLHGRLLSDDGTQMVEATDSCVVEKPDDSDSTPALGQDLGIRMAAKLRARAPHLVNR